MSKDFDQQKEELLQEVRAVLDDVEELYHSGVEEGSKEAEQLRGKLQRKLQAAQRKDGDKPILQETLQRLNVTLPSSGGKAGSESNGSQ